MKYHRVFSIAPLCKHCGKKGIVYDVRLFECMDGLIRRRKCLNCGAKWKTIELVYDEFKEAYNEGELD